MDKIDELKQEFLDELFSFIFKNDLSGKEILQRFGVAKQSLLLYRVGACFPTAKTRERIKKGMEEYENEQRINTNNQGSKSDQD